MTKPKPDLADTIKSAPENDQTAIAKLAKLSPMEYDRVRKIEAERLDVRADTLDREVAKARGNGTDAKPGQGQPLELSQPDPWPTAVNGAAVLDETAAAFGRFLALPQGAADTLALWAAHTHIFDTFDVTPRLLLVSPEKRCGKTNTLRVMARLASRPLMAGAITAAAVARTVEAARPTLIIDEAEALFTAPNDDLRTALNTGHATDGRCVKLIPRGDDFEPRTFSTFAPAALAAIGRLPDTIVDRAIVIAMRRRRPDEPVARCTGRALQKLADTARRIARFTHDNRLRLAEAEPEMPVELHDRAMDNWRPLIAIADLAGGDWPERARQATRFLSGADAPEETSAGTMLLSDIRDILEASQADHISSVELARSLADMEHRPWPEWKAGKPITVRQIARLLSPFRIKPRTVRKGADTTKGYKAKWFEDAFARYLPPRSVTPSQSAEIKGFSDFRSVTPRSDVTDENPPKAAENKTCDGVTDRIRESGGEGAWEAEL